MDKIVLLPQTKRQFIQTANEAFQAEDYGQAANILEELVNHHVSSFEIHLNLVVSLMKIKEWKKAIDYAEEFILLYSKDKKSKLSELVIMALFEQGDFSITLERIDEALEEQLSADVQQRIKMIRTLCQEQNVMRSKTLVYNIETLEKNEKHIELFYLIKEWKRLKVQASDVFYELLKKSHVHPMIKTFILEELQYNHIESIVDVEKFGNTIGVIPNKIDQYDRQDYVIELLDKVKEIEQQNPSVAQIMKQLIYQYSYIMYPFRPKIQDVPLLQQAFIMLSSVHFTEDTERETGAELKIHLENIQMCHHLYISLHNDTDHIASILD